MRRFGISLIALALLAPASAGANGRFPATVDTRFQPGDDQLILLPSTFGLLLSSDGGDTFRWVCEDAIGYGGTYDPDYAIAAGGDIYSTTFEGLRVSRDGGCTFETIGQAFGDKWVGEVEVASDGRVWATTSTGGESNDVYISDDGTSFESAGLLHESAWWQTLQTAPSDPNRVYVSGYLPAQGESDAEALLRRSVNGGESWEPLDVDDFEFGSQPQLSLLGVSPADPPDGPDLVFARVVGANPPTGDALYRSSDGGESWSRVLVMADTITAFTILEDGQTVIAGTKNPCEEDPEEADKGCVRISDDGGETWEAPSTEPSMACVGQRSDGSLFACGANWEPDFFAYGRSTDGGQSWEKVLRFADIAGPLECPEETIQAECAALTWPSVCAMLGICDPGGVDAGVGPGDADAGPGGGGGGCSCSHAGGGGLGALASCAFFLAIVRRRHR